MKRKRRICNKLDINHVYFNIDNLANNIPTGQIGLEKLSSCMRSLKIIRSYANNTDEL